MSACLLFHACSCRGYLGLVSLSRHLEMYFPSSTGFIKPEMKCMMLKTGYLPISLRERWPRPSLKGWLLWSNVHPLNSNKQGAGGGPLHWKASARSPENWFWSPHLQSCAQTGLRDRGVGLHCVLFPVTEINRQKGRVTS